MQILTRLPAFVLPFVLMAFATLLSAQTADRDRIEAFLEVTGFDVALDSIALSAGDAPTMLGLPPGSFGSDWTRVTEEVFDKPLMRRLAVDLLEKTLQVDKLNHAAAFYATELGQRLVEVENRSHMEEDDARKQADGRALVAEMVRVGASRLSVISVGRSCVTPRLRWARAMRSKVSTEASAPSITPPPPFTCKST
jgi:hypothetical protein